MKLVNIRILVVDDFPAVAEAIARQLRSEGATVTVAHDGASAMDILKCEVFSLVITDIFMPMADGLELITSIRTMARPPKVMAMSGGWHELPASLALYATKADDVMAKPFGMAELLEHTTQLLESAPSLR